MCVCMCVAIHRPRVHHAHALDAATVLGKGWRSHHTRQLQILLIKASTLRLQKCQVGQQEETRRGRIGSVG